MGNQKPPEQEEWGGQGAGDGKDGTLEENGNTWEYSAQGECEQVNSNPSISLLLEYSSRAHLLLSHLHSHQMVPVSNTLSL